MADSAVLGRRPDEHRFVRTLVAPASLILVITTTFPLVYLIISSFYSKSLSNPAADRFVGLGNYGSLLQDDRFWHSLWLSLIYTVSSVVLQVVIGLALAVAVHQIKRGAWLLQTVAILPILIAPVVVGLIWRTLLLTPGYGVIDYFSTVVGFGSHDWLGQPTTALIFTIIMHTWQWTPFCFLVFLASLASLPTELNEAAKLDRANAWNRFRYVSLPLLRPAIAVVAIIRTVVALSAFDAILAATGGGPGTATEILNLYVYRVTFSELSIGYGSALAVVLLLVTFGISGIFFRLRGRR